MSAISTAPTALGYEGEATVNDPVEPSPNKCNRNRDGSELVLCRNSEEIQPGLSGWIGNCTEKLKRVGFRHGFGLERSKRDAESLPES